MNNLDYLKILIVSFFSLIINIPAQSPTEFLSTENRLKFGDHLFCSGDYIRAIDEYNFVLNERDNDSLQFKIALALQQLNRLTEAKTYFNDLMLNSKLKYDATFEYYHTYYLAETIDRITIPNPRLINEKFVYQTEIEKMYNLTSLYSTNNLADSAIFFEPFNQNESIELLKFYLRKQNFSDKNPTLAGIMSAVIPGLGKIYTENYGEGITALLFTGVLTFLALDNFNAEHDFRGYLFAGLAAYFYAGNIYGSAVSAQIYNANLRISFDNDLKIFLNKNNHFLPKSKWLCK